MFVGILKKHWLQRSPENGAGGGGGDVAGGAEGATGDAPGAGATGGEGNGGEGGGAGDELTYEQLTAQAQEIQTKAEELRRSKLTEEERSAEDAAKAEAETTANANKAPEEYTDFKMPEGMPVDEQLLNDFKPLAKELGLPQEKAQKLIDLYAEKVAPLMQQRQMDAWSETRAGWVETAKLDKEIGGDKFDASLSDAMRVVNTLGTPELKEVFNQYGIGDNPEVVRVFARMSKYLKEDIPPGGGEGGGSGKSTAQDVYPYMNP